MGGTGVFVSLAEELAALFRRGVDEPLGEARFEELALRAFAWQFGANRAYRGFCLGRGASPEKVTGWRDVPAVPTTAFKFVDLACCDAPAEATFLTSGTTGGVERRGRHRVASLALYRASALPNLEAHLDPEGERPAILSLIPSPHVAPESSLSAMVGFAADAWGNGVRWLGHPRTGTHVDGFVRASEEAAAGGGATLVAGTAFAFVHLLEGLALREWSVRLPEGSRIMETGGFKGRSRAVERDELYRFLESRLGVPADRVVNEYGMTELLSQLWEPVLRVGAEGRGVHVPPPWLRVRALHPSTLEELPEGEPGLLAFYDLANLGSVCHVLTQDVGSVGPEGVRLAGRSEGAEPRGCSLALEELLAATEGHR
ncbi:MAG: coenzyme F390 synthetase [Gemmatimonadota bacterium]